MNLRTNPTPSQRNAHWEALAEAVVGAAVAPRSKKSKRRGGKQGRTASQKTRCPLPPSPESSPPPSNQEGKKRVVEVVEEDERARGNSIT